MRIDINYISQQDTVLRFLEVSEFKHTITVLPESDRRSTVLAIVEGPHRRL